MKRYNEVCCPPCREGRLTHGEHLCLKVKWEDQVEDYYKIARKFRQIKLYHTWIELKIEPKPDFALDFYIK